MNKRINEGSYRLLSLISRYESDPEDFTRRLITQDETWVHYFDPESKSESKVWKRSGSPRPKEPKRMPSARKVMASIFWDQDGPILVEYLPRGMTITGEYYAAQLHRLREAIKQKRRGKLSRGVLLLQDNAPAHRSQVAMTAVSRCGFELLPHPPYSPDLAPSLTTGSSQL